MACLGGGKRLRPLLVLQTSALFGVAQSCALRAAAAIEFIHCYSLVHDDLPAMDDSDLRRGRPTVHKQFDEATAILAGDALLDAGVRGLRRSGDARGPEYPLPADHRAGDRRRPGRHVSADRCWT